MKAYGGVDVYLHILTYGVTVQSLLYTYVIFNYSNENLSKQIVFLGGGD
jgi:hypothetical protein